MAQLNRYLTRLGQFVTQLFYVWLKFKIFYCKSSPSFISVPTEEEKARLDLDLEIVLQFTWML